MRTGLICKKLGMSRIFDSNGSHVPVTVLHLDNCHVISSMTEEKNGYSAVQIGVGKIKDKKLSKSMKGHFKKNKVEPKLKLSEFRVTPENLIDNGCHGAAIFGSTGQAQLIPISEKINLLNYLSESKYKDKHLIGTGLNSLNETINILKIAISLKFKKFLIMPPAYYKYEDKDAINFYTKIIESVPESEIILYNFEKLCGYKFSLDCIKELVKKKAALAKSAKLDGIICSGYEAKLLKKICKRMDIITPGIRLKGDSAGDQKRIMSPKDAFKNGATAIVMGRSITKGNIKNNIQKLIKSLN